jgi:hypothetical protein
MVSKHIEAIAQSLGDNLEKLKSLITVAVSEPNIIEFQMFVGHHVNTMEKRKGMVQMMLEDFELAVLEPIEFAFYGSNGVFEGAFTMTGMNAVQYYFNC